MVRPALAVVTLALALASDVARGCVFCGDGWSYDLSALSTETFVVHDGIPTEKNEPFAYLVTSPCGSVSTDTCIAGPTSDPIAMPNVQTLTPGLCVGLGTLNATYAPVEVVGRGDTGVTITLHSDFHRTTNYNVVCDPKSPPGTRPAVAAYQDTHGRKTFNVSWRHPAACRPTRLSEGCTATAPSAPPPPTCEGCLPRWRPTWNMSRSTVLYGCNASGPHNTAEAAAYGIMAYDWSHAKFEWVNSHPMNDDARLLSQAEAVMAVDPGVPGEQPKVWLYRNKIKALNWIGQVREKLDDPQFAGWFVRFKDYRGRASNNSYHMGAPACDWSGDEKSGPPKCSGFYHDQGQAPTREGAGPAYSRPSHGPVKSNVCIEQCDCGPTNPCGEYTFDHRNASFAKWYVDEWMISNQTLLHNPPISLGWLDE